MCPANPCSFYYTKTPQGSVLRSLLWFSQLCSLNYLSQSVAFHAIGVCDSQTYTLSPDLLTMSFRLASPTAYWHLQQAS